MRKIILWVLVLFSLVSGANASILCYQEFTNQTDVSDGGCILNYTGTYDITGSWTNPENALDGNWGTSTVPTVDSYQYIYMNYSKPPGALSSSMIQGRIGNDATANDTIPSACWTAYPGKIALYFGARAGGSPSSRLRCYNGTDFIAIQSDTVENCFEEAMIWDVEILDYVNYSTPYELENTSIFAGFIVNVTQSYLVWNGNSILMSRGYDNVSFSNFSVNFTVPFITSTLNNVGYDTKTFYINYSYGGSWYQTENYNQNVLARVFPSLYNSSIPATLFETQSLIFDYNVTNLSLSSISTIFNYSIYNQTGTASFLSTLNSNVTRYRASVTVPYVPDDPTIINIGGVINVTYNGTSSIRTSNTTRTVDKPSISIDIYSEQTGMPILENVTITYSDETTEKINSTTTGNIVLDGLNAFSEYSFKFSSANYSQRTYIITIGNETTQYLDVFLPLNTTVSTTIFTVSDKDTSEIIENAFLTMYNMVNGSWETVESKYTDITGKAQFTYITSTQYKFLISKSGYEDYVFYLDPILFSEYSVQIERSTLINYSQDYDNLAIIYYPPYFSSTEENTFNWIISSPTGLLLGYGYNLSYPGGSSSETGSNAIGGQLTSNFNITGASAFDNAVLNYYYITTLSGRRNFTILLPINYNATSSNMTFFENKDKTFGLGIFERMLIITIITVFIVGIASMVGQPIPGVFIGLLLFCFFAYIGFIPLWGVLPSIFIGVLFLTWKSGG